jgi:DNA helicase-2/ATP-dependent DNA helicase PcrA
VHTFCMSEIVRPFASEITPERLRIALPGGSAYQRAIELTSTELDMELDEVETAIKHIWRDVDGAPRGKAYRQPPRYRSVPNVFWAKLLETGHIDYPSVLYHALRILAEKPWVSKSLGARFSWVLVDEYQDSSLIQLKLFRWLHNGGAKLFLVGDLYQAIYGFTGVDVRSLRTFVADIGATTLPLSLTYRCGQTVCDVADRIFDRKLVPAGKAAAIEDGMRWLRDGAPAPLIISHFLPRCHNRGIELGEIAILSSKGDVLDAVLADLRKAGVPAVRQHARRDDSKWYAELAEAFLLARTPAVDDDLNRLTRSLITTMERFDSFPEHPSTATLISRAVAEFCLGLPSFPIVARVSDLLDAIENGILEILASSGAVSHAAIGAVRDGLRYARDHAPDDDLWHESCAQVIERTRAGGKVRGMTIHASKGLEFDAVAVIDVNEGSLPYGGRGDMWEDLRRLYVAVTRARRLLWIQYESLVGESRFTGILTGTTTAEATISANW